MKRVGEVGEGVKPVKRVKRVKPVKRVERVKRVGPSGARRGGGWMGGRVGSRCGCWLWWLVVVGVLWVLAKGTVETTMIVNGRLT